MKRCSRCAASYEGRLSRCPLDGGALVEVGEAREGELLGGRFRLGIEIGRGALGVVHRAVDERSGEAVAIKLLRPVFAPRERFRERFLREMRALSRVRHPSIVAIVGEGQDEGGRLFLATELLSGEPLSATIARGAMGAAEASTVARLLSSALSAAHREGVVHRDVKPANVMTGCAGASSPIKLLDFGLSRLADELGMTATGELCGTPAYMAPEQIEGPRGVSPGVDAYALGCVLFEMVAGRPPFTGPASRVLDAHLCEQAPRLSSLVGGVPARLDALVARLLEKDPGARASAGEAEAELGAIGG